MRSRAFWSVVIVCVCLPLAGRADDTGPLGIFHHYGYPRGPRVAPYWSYPGLTKGPTITYPTPPKYTGFFGYGLVPVDCSDKTWPNGVSFCRPPVPVYGPLPATFGDDPLVKQWRSTLAPGLVNYGWIGLYSAMPRPKHLSVHAWPTVNGTGTGPASGNPGTGATAGGCLTLSVKLPQAGAEVLVDGRATTQTGTDRTYESPPLETGRVYGYTVTARWVEGGQVVEVTKAVTGGPGEVVRVDFGAPAGAPAVAAGK
ncbi:TIGR03000 domain-containing protein [Frigoriglobus tundricola]|uniref:TIGR03000 domain-containing protein n=1 Tax=Frigoriglobus tundricola TaxID=2774151 RepID=A0A6M5YL94_9BACT|nr:TIGR03000 domain-containing protein [Frigoriglobus tundricola]QJW94869.1 hypothetical protein FTUN_2395 [Frigoriglobus tundricola]